jgi:hypothetical protein
MMIAALAAIAVLPASSAFAQPAPAPTLTLILRASLPLSRMVMVADISHFDEKFEASHSSGLPDAPATFHQFVERERIARRVEARIFNSERRANVNNVNRSVVYRVYYLCPGGSWLVNRYQLIDLPDGAAGTIRVTLDAQCS